jgi:lipopolysaccharide assembly outer membrane protein LptD (OstA)
MGPAYEGDPNRFQGFDRSALANQATAQGNAAGANQMALAKARLAATGAGRSSAANRQQMDLAGQMGQNAMNIQNQNALQGWQDKLAQMNAANQFNLNKYGLQQQQYRTDAGLAEAERQNRAQALSTAFGPIGGIANLFGNY